MKIFIAVIFIAASVMAFRVHPDMEKNAEECAKELKVDISMFKPGEKFDPKLFENKDYQCFAKCVATKFGVVNENGDANLDNIKKFFDASDALMEKVKACVAENQQDEKCERVFKTHDCVMKTIKTQK